MSSAMERRTLNCCGVTPVRTARRAAATASIIVLLLLGVAQRGWAYPDYFVSRMRGANQCLNHPTGPMGLHGAPQPDTETAVRLIPGFSSPAPAGKLCPGAQYTVEITFPQPRLALLTTSSGVFAGATSDCPNRVVTPSERQLGTWTSQLSVPCDAAGKQVQLKLTSAQSSTSAYRSTTATANVAPAAQCGGASASCSGGKQDAASAAGGADALRNGGTTTSPQYALRPIIRGNRQLWQIVHSLLMLVSFGLLMPVGALLSRHRWAFGRDASTSKAIGTWLPVHMITQVAGAVTACGGVAIALLAFGWKDVPGLPLYAAHQYIGVLLIVLVLAQVVMGLLRPSPSAARRVVWRRAHWCVGRFALLFGAINLLLGAALVHQFKGVALVNWMLPVCLLLAVVGLLALTLEAFKRQMVRTYRLNPKTGEMTDVITGVMRHRAPRQEGQPQRDGPVVDGSSGSAEVVAETVLLTTPASGGASSGGIITSPLITAPPSQTPTGTPAVPAPPAAAPPSQAPNLTPTPSQAGTSATLYPPVQLGPPRS